MSDYRRLISYIYEYEGKEKGKNVGFVKLEARNGQCRLNLSVKKVYMGSSAIGVFLLSKTGTEVFLGNIFIRSGAGEFRAVVDAKNVEGNGGGLDTYYGLTIHDVKNPWRSYTTIWEDAVEPETLPGSLPGDQGNGDTVKMLPAQEILPGSPDRSEEEPVMAVASVVREIEAEIAREEERRSREEMIQDPASAPEMLPAGPAVPPVPEELPYSPPPAPSIPEGPAMPPEPSVVPAPEELPVRPPAPPVPEELPAGPSVLPVPEELPARPPAPKETPDEPETPVFPEELPPAPAPGASPAEPVRLVPHPEGDPPAPVSRADGGLSELVSRAERASSEPISRAEGGSSEPISRADGGSSEPVARADGGSSEPVSRAEGAPSEPVSCPEGRASVTVSRPAGSSPAAASRPGTALPERGFRPAAARRPGPNPLPSSSRTGDSRPESETVPPSGQAAPEKDSPLSRSPELENPEVLRYLQETEDVTADPEKLWQELRKSYPKIQPFDYESGCEILTIRPQDIGRLPRESWVYGNNSFLLHGYYNFRYIILFRLGNKDGRARYLIGVPGHYYSSEKYMASMFGFPNFVLSKKQPPNDGRFGYWYTDIRVR